MIREYFERKKHGLVKFYAPSTRDQVKSRKELGRTAAGEGRTTSAQSGGTPATSPTTQSSKATLQTIMDRA